MGKVQYIIFNWQSKPSILSQLEFQKGCSEVKCRMETGFNVRGWRNLRNLKDEASQTSSYLSGNPTKDSIRKSL
jgi:hypothetical protein